MADEIHALNKNEIQDIDYDTYFGEMDLSDEEKEDRKKLAEKFEKIFVMLFALLSGKEETEITTITKEFIIRYESIATQYCKAKKTPSYITDYARYIVNEVVDATTQNTEVEYFTSQKRAKNVAANEANAVGNYRLQTDMVKQGYKTKEWRSKEDSHVRPTHAEVDRKRIDIFEPFEVGNKITTRALEGKLLNPGDSATVKVIFTWKNGAENLGLKTNIAEISEDYNDKGSKDIDSTPDNVKTDDYDKQQEDDDDKALVILEIKTGGSASYIWLGLVVLTILAGGVLLIKKFVI